MGSDTLRKQRRLLAVNRQHEGITIITAEKEFETELKVFEGEINETTQCFYVWDSIRNIARNDRRVLGALNRSAPFWSVAVRSVQATSLIVLGRIFDTDARSHSVNRLLNLAETNADIFSKSSLERCKRSIGGNINEWIGEFMKDAYVPKASDFRSIRRYVSRNRSVHDRKYAPFEK